MLIWHTCPDYPDGHAAALDPTADRLPCGCVAHYAACGRSEVTWVGEFCDSHEVPW